MSTVTSKRKRSDSSSDSSNNSSKEDAKVKSDEKYSVKSSDVTRIQFKGSASATIDKTVSGFSIKGGAPVFCTVEGSVLIIEEEGSGSSSSSVNVFNGSNMTFGNVLVMGSGLSVSTSNGYVEIRGNPKGIKLNGQLVDLGKKAEKKTDSKYSEVWQIDNGGALVNSVSVQGACEAELDSEMLARSVAFRVTGSGGITITKDTFEKISVTVAGSGDVDLNQSITNAIDISLSGSGDVKSFKAIKTCDVMLAGSGDVRGEVAKGCAVSKDAMGSGDIKLYRV